MKAQLAKPFLFLVAFILIVGLACSATAPDAPAPEAPAPAQEAASPVPLPPTAIPAPTNVPEPTAVPEPTIPPTPVVQKYFTEEFDNGLDNWRYLITSGEESGVDFILDNGRLVFDIQDQNLYSYQLYAPEVYDDVTVEMEANNRGANSNDVSLICRYDDDSSDWYEFNIGNDGLYSIFSHSSAGYDLIFNGGSTEINSGKDTNQYAITCKGPKLTLYINGVEVREVQDKRLREGWVGIGVSSYDIVPINVEIEWVKISEP